MSFFALLLVETVGKLPWHITSRPAVVRFTDAYDNIGLHSSRDTGSMSFPAATCSGCSRSSQRYDDASSAVSLMHLLATVNNSSRGCRGSFAVLNLAGESMFSLELV
ncbi:hypothetical protein H257_06899 [Aphanomyces astaci]|uniref:Uncharacterized protein n=1 Tax=Aphanomyces astaci TaxID=112090 RepID=W4GIZ5_APHAT|nr:hypothetical protein H257_06899 [Aphanomyces astaci]ETV79642.1 hypothetical protein H257_06899 [Aphanomyces astaci]|eukprot:XP_009830578.1 hypothetical protein H257_06899 [Aphanomyces astaci]